MAAPCTTGSQCAAGLVCDAGACTSGAALDAECSGPAECGELRTCMRAPETRTCGAPSAEGASCEPETCATGLLCDSTRMSCVALPGLDEPCLDGFYCASGLACDDGTRLCRTLPGLEEPCFTGAQFCAPGLGCDEVAQVCRSPGGDGTACLLNPPDYLCGEGFGCAFEANGSFCRPLQGDGGECTNDRSCDSGTYCDFGTLRCRTRLGRGEACPLGNECGEGLVCAPLAGSFTCEPIPGPGEPCVATCTQGQVCRGAGGRCAPELCAIP